MSVSQTSMTHMMKSSRHRTEFDFLGSIASLEAIYRLDMTDNDDPTLDDEDEEEEEDDEDNDGYDENPDH